MSSYSQVSGQKGRRKKNWLSSSQWWRQYFILIRFPRISIKCTLNSICRNHSNSFVFLFLVSHSTPSYALSFRIYFPAQQIQSWFSQKKNCARKLSNQFDATHSFTGVFIVYQTLYITRPNISNIKWNAVAYWNREDFAQPLLFPFTDIHTRIYSYIVWLLLLLLRLLFTRPSSYKTVLETEMI